MAHAIYRTSPKGKEKPFIGTCIKCGLTDLTMFQAEEYCENTANLTQEQVILLAIGKANAPSN